MSDSREIRADPQLTIVLTLKDRVAYTVRWMEYANSIAFPFKVLIADGGLEDSALQLLSDKTRFPNVNYEYVRYPPDDGYADYYAKMADALARVRTPYVAMADNDDFFVVSGLEKSIQFLSGNGGYVSCGGQGAIFWMRPAPPADPGRLVYGTELDWKCTREMRSIDASTASERLRIVSASTSDTYYYDVKRSEESRRQFALVRDLNMKDLFLVEYLIKYLSAIAGKSMRLDQLYLARQQNSPGSSGGEHAVRFGDWFGRMLVPSWSEDFGKFLHVASGALAEKDAIPAEEARRSVIEHYRAAVAPQLLSDLMDEPTVTVSMSTVVGAVRRVVRLSEDSAMKRFARMLYRRLRWVSLDIVYGTELIATPVPNAQRDFRPIRDFLARAK